ncbi:MAG TPA: TRAP transporter large permease, partial [Trueperaceae bacterium]|nr:TRAP transporter large permease [Trueperaceae bacterium]
MLLLTVGAVITLMLLGVPVAIALAATTIGFFAIEQIPIETFIQMVAKGVDSFTLLALPFFILTGKLMNLGGATERIFRLGNASVGHIRGGMAHANVAASFLFAGISGSAVADAGGLGAVEIETMRKAGYTEDFSVGVTAASATIGPIIPPSVIMIVYGIAAGVPIGALFIGGIIPGTLMALALMGTVAVISRVSPVPESTAFSARALLLAIVRAGFALLTPAIIVLGILSGAFTVTESGAVAAAYSIVLGLFIYRELNLRSLWKAITESMVESAGILLIIGVASGFAWMMSFQQAPQATIEGLLGLTQNPVVILLLLGFLYLVLGLFIE